MKKLKKLILGIFICLTVLSCENGKVLELKEATVAQGLCKLFVEKKYEAAYTRMNDSYKVGTSLEKFQSEIQKNFSDVSQIKNTKISLLDENDFYYSILCEIKTDSKTKYSDFIFSKGNFFPVEVKFLQEKPKAKKNKKSEKKYQTVKSGNFDLSLAMGEDSLKDLCSEYFKLGCGLYGYNIETCSINHKEYMDVAKKHFNSCTLTNLMKPVYILSERKSAQKYQNEKSEPVLNFECIDETLK